MGEWNALRVHDVLACRILAKLLKRASEELIRHKHVHHIRESAVEGGQLEASLLVQDASILQEAPNFRSSGTQSSDATSRYVQIHPRFLDVARPVAETSSTTCTASPCDSPLHSENSRAVDLRSRSLNMCPSSYFETRSGSTDRAVSLPRLKELTQVSE